MKGFLSLAKVNFLSLLLSTVGGSGSKKKQRSGWAALLFLALMMLIISGNYSLLLVKVLGPMGGQDIMLMLMILIGLCFSIFLTVYLSQSLLFSSKDIDLVLSLPVSSFSVLLARLMALYLEILFMMEIFLLPCGIAYLTGGGQGGAVFLVLLLLSGVFLSFIPSFFSLLFGIIISLLIYKTRFKNLFNTVFSIVLTLAVGVLAFAGTDYLENLNTTIEPLRAFLVGNLPPLAWLVQAVTGPNLLLFLLVAALCVTPFFLLALLISRFYKKMLTSLLNQHVRSDYKLGRAKANGCFRALLGKEARRFLGTPAYLLNHSIGLVLMLLGAVALLFFRGNIQEFLSLFTATPEWASLAISSYLPAALLGCSLFLLMMFLPTTVSISLEGKQLWILKEAPISANTIFLAKAGFPFIAGGICCTFSLFIAGFVLALPFISTLLVWLVSLSFLALTSLTGLVVNTKHPRLDVENDIVVIKQSGSTLLGMLFSLLEVILLAGLYFLLTMVLGLGFTTYALLSVVLLLATSWLLYSWLKTRGSKLFLQI